MKELVKGIYYVGVSDKNIDLFEGNIPVPDGMAYNSYVVRGEKTAVIDSVDQKFGEEWLKKVEKTLGGVQPDYIVVLHMEPDHSANVFKFTQKYPKAQVVGNSKTFVMLKEYFGTDYADRAVTVKDGDELDLGGKSLKFVFAPMVHWPEVMTAYEATTKTLFSVDAFGKFGSDVDGGSDIGGGEWEEEARRYYFAIVGKYGVQVQSYMKKLAPYAIERICSLHGPVLDKGLDKFLGLYAKWSAYEPEEDGVFIAYSSVYGHTQKAVERLEEELKAKGVKVKVLNVIRTDYTYCIAEAFRYSKIVLATTTYNGDIFPNMREFVDCLVERNFKNRKVGIIENGSWAPFAAKAICAKLEKCKDLEYVEPFVKIRSALSDESLNELLTLADALVAK